MKKTERYIKVTGNRFAAPESVRLFFNNKEIKMNSHWQSEIGYAYYTNKEKCLKLIKQFIRTRTSLGNSPIKSQLMCFVDTSNSVYNLTGYNGYCNQFDIERKLELYKGFKEAQPLFEVRTRTLDGNYRPINERDDEKEIEKPKIKGIFFK